jgi:hypothetical protein
MPEHIAQTALCQQKILGKMRNILFYRPCQIKKPRHSIFAA